MYPKNNDFFIKTVFVTLHKKYPRFNRKKNWNALNAFQRWNSLDFLFFRLMYFLLMFLVLFMIQCPLLEIFRISFMFPVTFLFVSRVFFLLFLYLWSLILCNIYSFHRFQFFFVIGCSFKHSYSRHMCC